MTMKVAAAALLAFSAGNPIIATDAAECSGETCNNEEAALLQLKPSRKSVVNRHDSTKKKDADWYDWYYANGFVPYFDYTGDLRVAGSVVFRPVPVPQDGEASVNGVMLSWRFWGVDPKCEKGPGIKDNSCGVHIHAGTSCDESAGPHYWNDDTREKDPWGCITYTSWNIGFFERTVMTNELCLDGFEFEEILGHTFIVHDYEGDRVACGIIREVGDWIQLPIDEDKIPEDWDIYFDGWKFDVDDCLEELAEGTTLLKLIDECIDVDDDEDAAKKADAAKLKTYVESCAKSRKDGTDVDKAKACVQELALESCMKSKKDGTIDDKMAECMKDTEMNECLKAQPKKMSGEAKAEQCVQDVGGKDKETAQKKSQGRSVSLFEPREYCANNIVKYVAYQGSLPVPTGEIHISDAGMWGPFSQMSLHGQRLSWDLEGVDSDCSGGPRGTNPNSCGIHIHEGTSCTDPDGTGPHYWNPKLGKDPWTCISYTSFNNEGLTGEAKTPECDGIPVLSGYTLEDVKGRTIIIHDVEGARVACAVIEECHGHD